MAKERITKLDREVATLLRERDEARAIARHWEEECHALRRQIQRLRADGHDTERLERPV